MTGRIGKTILALVLVLTGACAKDVDLPAAKPLTAAPEQIAALYGASAGPHEVVIERGIQHTGQGEQRDLSLSIFYPAGGEHFPILLFSHGNWSDNNSYDQLLQHWVSHGYVVIAADHLDCCSMAKGIFNSLRYGNLGLIEARVEDIRWLLDSLSLLEQAIPNLKGKIDNTRIAMTRHSFGGISAQQFGGAAALDPDTGRYHSALDARVSAIVSLSPPGPMFDEITPDSWDELRTPTLVSTGTWDIQPGFWDNWRDHLLSFENAVPGDKYSLVIEGADHFLGNLICRTDREEPPQNDALAMLQITTTAFLDTYLKNSGAARQFLESNALQETTGEFAHLDRR